MCTPVTLRPGRLSLSTKPPFTGPSPLVKTTGTFVVAAENSGGLGVDDHLELTRLYHRQVLWFRALEDTTDIDAGLAKSVRRVAAITHQPPGLDIFTPRIARWYALMRRPVRQLHTPA